MSIVQKRPIGLEVIEHRAEVKQYPNCGQMQILIVVLERLNRVPHLRPRSLTRLTYADLAAGARRHRTRLEVLCNLYIEVTYLIEALRDDTIVNCGAAYADILTLVSKVSGFERHHAISIAVFCSSDMRSRSVFS